MFNFVSDCYRGRTKYDNQLIKYSKFSIHQHYSGAVIMRLECFCLEYTIGFTLIFWPFPDTIFEQIATPNLNK
jgi:hypothetical protein